MQTHVTISFFFFIGEKVEVQEEFAPGLRLVRWIPGSDSSDCKCTAFSAMCSWPPPSYAHLLGPCVSVTLG